MDGPRRFPYVYIYSGAPHALTIRPHAPFALTGKAVRP